MSGLDPGDLHRFGIRQTSQVMNEMSCFFIDRCVLFVVTGAQARALGFALTFYLTVLLLVAAMCFATTAMITIGA